MGAPDAIPVSLLSDASFLDDVDDDDLVYFLLNVGDGDTQLVVLPAQEEQTTSGIEKIRRALVVDVATTRKLPALLKSLGDTPLLPDRDDLITVVVATHPHEDHIGGMAEFIELYGDRIAEFWEPGYYHPTAGYMEMMYALEDSPHVIHMQPTSGMTRFMGMAKVTVLSPAMRVRSLFDSYGVEINNSSLSLRIEIPAMRVEERQADRSYKRIRSTQALVLGGDTQTFSWSHVLVDFPQLHPERSAAAKALRMALGSDPLRAQVLKVSHHGSKHGVSLELIEAVKPSLSLISSVGGGGKYNFPHSVTQDAIREALQPIASGKHDRKLDHELGIHYTSAVDSDGEPLGSLAIVMSPTGRKRHLWRFGDQPKEAVDLNKARKFDAPR